MKEGNEKKEMKEGRKEGNEGSKDGRKDGRKEGRKEEKVGEKKKKQDQIIEKECEGSIGHGTREGRQIHVQLCKIKTQN